MPAAVAQPRVLCLGSNCIREENIQRDTVPAHSMRLACHTVASTIIWPARSVSVGPILTGRSARHLSLKSRATVSGVQKESKEAWTADAAGRRKEHQRDDLHVVLVHPQIPQNAGSISRTCAATSVALHLVRPLGFEIDDVKLKRAGLDYWPYVVVNVHDSWAAFYEFFQAQQRPGRLIAFSKFGERAHFAAGTYKPGDWLVFGAETSGLPPEAHEAAAHVVRIPMIETFVRCINLSVSVGIGLYEAIRQVEEQQ